MSTSTALVAAALVAAASAAAAAVAMKRNKRKEEEEEEEGPCVNVRPVRCSRAQLCARIDGSLSCRRIFKKLLTAPALFGHSFI